MGEVQRGQEQIQMADVIDHRLKDTRTSLQILVFDDRHFTYLASSAHYKHSGEQRSLLFDGCS